MSGDDGWLSQVDRRHRCAHPDLSDEAGTRSLWRCPGCGKVWAVAPVISGGRGWQRASVEDHLQVLVSLVAYVAGWRQS